VLDQDTLRRLELSPVFVGVERKFIETLIGGDPEEVRAHLSEGEQGTEHDVRRDAAAGWFVRLGGGTEIAS
jgi:anthranilate phosphoribosyltransferase